MKKKLYRSKEEKMLCGVCAGLAKYFDIDSTIVRLIWVFASLACGVGILPYLICAIVIPNEPEEQFVGYTDVENYSEENK